MNTLLQLNILETFKSTFGDLGTMLVKVVGALLILFIGWMIAKFIKGVVVKLLKKAKVDGLLAKAGITEQLQKAGLKNFSLSKLMGMFIYIIIMLMVILSALNALNLTAVTEMFQQIMAFIPKLIVVAILLVIGMYAAKFVRDMVLNSGMAADTKSMVAKIAYYGIMVIVGFMSLSQLGIAPKIVNTAFTLLLGSICVGGGLAVGIAFGLGGKDKAGNIVDKYINK